MDSNLSHTADVGAKKFRAPEVYSNYYDAACDVWSFAIVAATLLQVKRKVRSFVLFCSDISGTSSGEDRC